MGSDRLTKKQLIEENKALRETLQRFESIRENLVEGILLAERESGKLIGGNPALCRMLGIEG